METGNPFHNFTTRTENEDGQALAILHRPKSGWAKEANKWAQIDFTFEHFEGQDEVSSKASAFQ